MSKTSIFVGCGILSLSVLIAVIVCAVRSSTEAEKTLHAVIIASKVLEQYLRDHPGQWPSSWRELQQQQLDEHWVYSWPRDYEEVSKRARIHFTVPSRDDLLSQSFSPVEPIGVCYPYKHYLGELMDVIRSQKSFRQSE